MSKRRTTSIGDGIGADQRAQWRKALTASKRQQRQRRGRKQATPSYQPGMARINPPSVPPRPPQLTTPSPDHPTTASSQVITESESSQVSGHAE